MSLPGTVPQGEWREDAKCGSHSVIGPAGDFAQFQHQARNTVFDVHLHEFAGQGGGDLEVGRLEHGIAAQHLLGLGKRAIGDVQRP